MLEVANSCRRPFDNSFFRMEEAPNSEPCLSNSLSIDSMISTAFGRFSTSVMTFLKRSSTSPLYWASPPRAAVSSS